MRYGSTQATVSVALVKILQAYARAVDVDFGGVAGEVGFNAAIMLDSDARISARIFESLWLKIAVQGRDPLPGLGFGRQAGEYYPLGSILYSLMRNSPTIGRALELFVRFHRLMANTIQPVVTPQSDVVNLTWDLERLHLPLSPHLSEALLCTYHGILNNLSPHPIVPVKVCLSHPLPAVSGASAQFQRFFGCPVYFNAAENTLVLSSQNLDIRLELADERLVALLEAHAKKLFDQMEGRDCWSTRVAGIIGRAMGAGTVPVLDTIARGLGLSRRSLQEKLQREGVCYRTIVEGVRRQIAIDQLARPDVSLCEVAFLLGYSDQSAFTNAFKRWTGVTPGNYRQK